MTDGGSSTHPRRASTSRPSAGPTGPTRRKPTRGADRRPDRDPQVRHLEPGRRRSTAAAAGSPASCSASGRSPSTGRAPRRQHRDARPGGARAGETESFLTTLRPKDGALVQAGRIGGLGKGERVYAVRFVGDTGYVVTFRRSTRSTRSTSRDPERPRVLGELKIPGYSAYLHPIGDDLLLGDRPGRDEQGRPPGTQLSIFDVSDLRHPTRLHAARSARAGRRRSPTLTRSSSGRGRAWSWSRSISGRSASASADARHRRGRTRRARRRQPRMPRGSAARSSSATASSRSPTPASSRAASRR